MLHAILEIYPRQHGSIQEAYVTYMGGLWGGQQGCFREDFLCSPLCISKVSQNRPGGETVGRGDNMSTSTEVGKSKAVRTDNQVGLEQLCACRVATASG